MNRYLTVSILIIIYSFSGYFIYNYPQAIDVQETNLVDNQSLESLEDKGKLKNIYVSMATALVMTTLFLTSSFNLMISIVARRLMLITTIFYQSNYLINSFEVNRT